MTCMNCQTALNSAPFSVYFLHARGQAKCSCTILYGSETCGTAHWNDKASRHFHLRLVPSAAAEGDDYLFFPFQEMELRGSHAWDALIRIFQPMETWKKPLEWNLQLSCSALSFHISHSIINYSFWHKQLAQCKLQEAATTLKGQITGIR